MSTKNLSRTIIEGGRRKRNKWERRHSNRALRAKVREYMHGVMKNPDASDEDYEPTREKVYKDFDDKLGPIYRWLHAQEGRPWDDVRSEIHQKFDLRTTAGRHIIYDHLLRSVQETPNYDYGRNEESWFVSIWKNDFYVEDGILRAKDRVKCNWYPYPAINTYPIVEWLNGRIIGKSGNKLYWFLIKSKSSDGWADEWKCEWLNSYYGHPTNLVYLKKTQVPVYIKDKLTSYKEEWREPFYYKFKRLNARQWKELSDKDVEYFNSLPEYYQEAILEWSPLNKNPRKISW